MTLLGRSTDRPSSRSRGCAKWGRTVAATLPPVAKRRRASVNVPAVHAFAVCHVSATLTLALNYVCFEVKLLTLLF